MLSNISKLQMQVNNKTYQLLCDMDSPLTDVKEALFQFQKYVGHIEDEVRKQQEAANAIASTSEQAPVEVSAANIAVQTEAQNVKG